MPGRYIATGLYSEVVVNRGSTVFSRETSTKHYFLRPQDYKFHMGQLKVFGKNKGRITHLNLH